MVRYLNRAWFTTTIHMLLNNHSKGVLIILSSNADERREEEKLCLKALTDFYSNNTETNISESLLSLMCKYAFVHPDKNGELDIPSTFNYDFYLISHDENNPMMINKIEKNKNK